MITTTIRRDPFDLMFDGFLRKPFLATAPNGREASAWEPSADVAADAEAAGLALLARMLQTYPTTTFTCLNVSWDDPMLPTLRRAGFEEMITQYEMVLELS